MLSSDSLHYRQAYEGFQAEWGSTVPFILAGSEEAAVQELDAVVAFGSRAALREWPASVVLETCLALGARPARRDVLRVGLLPEPAALIARMKKLLPRLSVLRVLWSSDFEREEVDALSAAAEEQGVQVLSEHLEEPDRLPARVRRFEGRADALWLMPDPALVNPENFAILREYSAAARTPLLAPTEGLAEKGAAATVAVSFADIGRAAAAALKTRLRGGPSDPLPRPSRIVVTVSAAAARASGLDVKSAQGVDQVIP